MNFRLLISGNTKDSYLQQIDAKRRIKHRHLHERKLIIILFLIHKLLLV